MLILLDNDYTQPNRASKYFPLGERLVAVLWYRYHHSGLGDAAPSSPPLTQHHFGPCTCSVGTAHNFGLKLQQA